MTNSPYLNLPLRSRAEVSARRDVLAADMRAEGTPEAVVERLATDETAARRLDEEARVVAWVRGMFGDKA